MANPGPSRLIEAAQAVIKAQYATPSLLQRQLGVGYAHARQLLAQLEAADVVGVRDPSGGRDVLVRQRDRDAALAKLAGAATHARR